MGLLDITDDPQQAGLLSLGLRLMSTPGKFGTALGQAGLGAMGDMRQAQQAAQQRKQEAMRQQMLQMQMQQMQQAQAEAQALKQSRGAYLDSIDANAGPAMPLSVPQAMRAGLGMPEIQALMPAKAENPFGKVDTKDFTPESVRRFAATNNYADLVPVRKREFVNNQAVDPYATPVGTVIPSPSNPVTDMLVTDPVTGRLVPNAALIAAKSQVAKAGATNIPVSVNTVKPLMTTMAEGLGKQLDSNLGAARAAVDTIGGAQRIRNLLDTGQVVSGPTADWRIAARQVGSVLGVGGKNDEVLANTRRTIQQLAQFELDAAQSMKGQGQITEAEREILRRAAAGNISFTEPELRALADSLEGRARKRIKSHNEDVDRLGQMPEGSQLMPFYRVPEPGGSAADDLVKKYATPQGQR